MQKKDFLYLPIVFALLLLFSGCDSGTCTPAKAIIVPGTYNPTLSFDGSSTTIDNPYMPLTAGTTFAYEGTDDDGSPIHNTVEVMSGLAGTKVVGNVTCVVVHDRVETAGVLSEETLDWYAQDTSGNVWYFGEDSKEFAPDGITVISTEGSWKAGVNGALPGIVMETETNIVVGHAYRQEYAPGVAEDLFETIGTGESVTGVYGGPYTLTVTTREWTPLEPCVSENKYYARDVGLVRVRMTKGGSEEVHLTAKTP